MVHCIAYEFNCIFVKGRVCHFSFQRLHCLSLTSPVNAPVHIKSMSHDLNITKISTKI